MGEIVEQTSFKLVRAGLCENLNSTEAQFVVLGRKGVLVNPDFTYGFLGREFSSAESVDEHRASTGSSA
jgi:hypothetical protein